MPIRWAGACRAVMNTCDDGAKRNVFARLSEPYTTAAAFAVRRNTHFYAMAIASQSACARLRWRDWKPTDMRTPPLPRLSASRDACLEGGREPRGARIAGGFRCQGRRADAERSLCGRDRRREHPEGAAKRAQTPLAGAPALRPPRRATAPKRRCVPYSRCFVDWKAVSYAYTRPTWHCSRPLRARDRWYFEASASALAAAECQAVGRQRIILALNQATAKLCYTLE